MEGSAPKLAIGFRPRAEPLAAVAAAARGAPAIALAERLLGRDDAALGALSGVTSRALLVITTPGYAAHAARARPESAVLPWIDGIVYLGHDPAAPSLLLPTAVEPDVPLPLFERALMAREGVAAPIAVLVDPPLLVPLASARPIERERLLAWLEAERGG